MLHFVIMRKDKLFSPIYTSVRSAAVHRAGTLEDAIDWGDGLVEKMPSILKKAAFAFDIPDHLETSLYDLRFPSPLIVSSFKDNFDLVDLWLMLGMGGATLKTIMKDPRKGNAKPRIQEVTVRDEKTLINALGLPGKGVKEFTRHMQRNARIFGYNRPIGISIGGNSVNEYFENIQVLDPFLDSIDSPTYFEINISCPNTHDGQNMLDHPSMLEDLLRNIRQITSRVVGVKLSPDQTNESLELFAEIAKGVSRTFLTIGNTQYRKCESVGLNATDISVGGGGLSGGPLFKRTLEMTELLAGMKIPLIATGGINSPQRAKAVRDAGATLIGMASALVLDPYCVPRINHSL